ncbi:pilus assembly protein [Pseudomonas sp. LPB0260]|uniref:TadE/TadG family type IV pilus assembly protein n=1 Tax=Pseudomonas sp. LPB0260 TaxID=2614442 RepID=UPI0015C1F530|nr:TadE/TadG family type IV pilus assembly protein [Pseudomonas sp. LPB0260]QLC72166.1 pilus assembly protein [Pseudomonas sp. LPB0260]QLC74944.1 pilus assembly protein [Pseudomonas sp. LPB0260]
MSTSAFKPLHTQRGVAMVEFAIALPLLLLLLLAIGEFGRLLYHYNNLQQASRDAGRYVAGQAWNATLGQIELSGDLQTRTKNVAVYGVPANPSGYASVVPDLSTGDVQVSSVGAEHVRVSITYTFRPVIGNALPTFFGSSIPLNIALNSTVVMRAL